MFIGFLPIKAANPAIPGETKAYLTIPLSPAYNPAIAPPIIEAIKGFFNLSVTPKSEGSVMPINADKPADPASCFKSLFLVLTATASVAPACAILEANMPGPLTVSCLYLLN